MPFGPRHLVVLGFVGVGQVVVAEARIVPVADQGPLIGGPAVGTGQGLPVVCRQEDSGSEGLVVADHPGSEDGSHHHHRHRHLAARRPLPTEGATRTATGTRTTALRRSSERTSTRTPASAPTTAHRSSEVLPAGPGCGHQHPDRQGDGDCLRHHGSVTGDQCRRDGGQAGGDQADARPSGHPATEEAGQQDGDAATECAGQLESGAGGDAQLQEPGEEQRIAGTKLAVGFTIPWVKKQAGIRIAVAAGHEGAEQHVADGVETQFQVSARPSACR